MCVTYVWKNLTIKVNSTNVKYRPHFIRKFRGVVHSIYVFRIKDIQYQERFRKSLSIKHLNNESERFSVELKKAKQKQIKKRKN